MIIVDTALQAREASNTPIRVGVIGTGYMGRGFVLQVLTSFQTGMRISAVYNRTLGKAKLAFEQSGHSNFKVVSSCAAVESAVASDIPVISEDPLAICRAENIDVIVEATGEVEFGAVIALEALKFGKHLILMNAELDALVGPRLKQYADAAGVVISNVDGDQPGGDNEFTPLGKAAWL